VLALGQMGQYDAIGPALIRAMCSMGICTLVIFKNKQCFITQSYGTDFVMKGQNK